MTADESRTSNALGVPIPIWIINQLEKRSKELSVNTEGKNSQQINENLLFRANTSAWTRMVSSIDLISPIEASINKAFDYFQKMGLDIQKQSDLAKLFILQGGVSKYTSTPSSFSYSLRNGFKESYNATGTTNEIREYGYRPMPGITSVRVQTQGKLGSIRSADIQLKVWDKDQLDIIDALYFKLGYTMLLEWGHTNYYEAESGELKSSEDYAINPFEQGITKEDIFNKIANNVRDSEGNYDAMLGMVTNFNFTYNQEGGYDCTIKLISLGALISSMKMNNPRILPKLQNSVIKKFINRLIELRKQEILGETSTNSDELNAYPPCIRNRGSITSVKSKDATKKPLSEKGILAVVNNVQYFFYASKKYQTSALSKSGTYDCNGEDLIIDGVSENEYKKTYEQIVKGNEKSILQLYAPYSVSSPLSVLINGVQLDTLRGIQNLNKPYAYEIKVGNNDYIALNKYKSLLPVFSFASNRSKYNVQAKIKLPNFVLIENASTPTAPIESLSQPTFRGGINADTVPKISVQKKALDLLTQIREVGTSYGQNPIIFEGSGVSINRVIDFGTSDFDKNSTQKYRNYYKSYIQYTNQIDSQELQDYLLVLSYSAEAISSRNEKKSTSPKPEPETNTIKLASDQEKIRQKIIEALNNSEELWRVINVSRISPSFPYSDLNRSIPKILISLEKEISVSLPTEVVDPSTVGLINPITGEKSVPKTEIKDEDYKIQLRIDTTDIGIIDGLSIKIDYGFTILDSLSLSNEQTDQNTEQIDRLAEVENEINAADVQTSETLKYKSAFEVIIRTLQLYSLDNAIEYNIETDKTVKSLNLLEPKTYQEFTKTLFDKTGVFSEMLDDITSWSKKAITNPEDSELVTLCVDYDKNVRSGNAIDKYKMLKIRALFGFHFGLLGNATTAQELLSKRLVNDYEYTMSTYTVPYEFNSGVIEGTQLNHPVYLPLGFIIMILNHICTIYDNKKPLVYIDFNNRSNLCLSNAKQLSTNPYEVLIPFEGSNQDFVSIIEPTTLATEGLKEKETKKIVSSKIVIKPASGTTEYTPVYTPQNSDTSENALVDRISPGLPRFKIIGESGIETYRGRTMNIVVSCDYLLKIVGNFSKNNGSGDVYIKEFIEQILFDINKSIGDINIFRLAYYDAGNVSHIVDDQSTPNLENRYLKAIEDPKDASTRSRLPLFGKGSIARTLEIRSEVSSKLSNMIAISANSNTENQSSLSKSADSFGFYNTSYRDRYLPNRTEYADPEALPTDTMIRSSIQFNESINTFYGKAKPADDAVGHATNYYIQRMSKIKTNENGTRASAMIPVSLNFSLDGMSGFGMGQSFTISDKFLPYTYNLKITDPFGQTDQTRTVAFVVVGLDHTIENNYWISSLRSNMIFAKSKEDFEAENPKPLRGLGDPISLSTTTANTVNYNAGLEKSVPIEPKQRIKIAKEFFEKQGFTKPQVSAIIGGLLQESQLNPNALNTTTPSKENPSLAYGIAQWLGNRKTNLQSRQNYSSLEIQLQYVIEEFNGLNNESKAGKRIRAAKTLEDAIAAMASYERYKGVGYDATYKDVLAAAIAGESGNRIGYSKNIFNTYNSI